MEGKAVVVKDNILQKTLKHYIEKGLTDTCGVVERVKVSDVIDVVKGDYKKYLKKDNPLGDDIETETRMVSNGWNQWTPLILEFRHTEYDGEITINDGSKRLAWMIKKDLLDEEIPVVYRFINRHTMFEGMHFKYNDEYVIYHSDGCVYDPENEFKLNWLPIQPFLKFSNEVQEG